MILSVFCVILLGLWSFPKVFMQHLVGSCPQPSLRQYVARECVRKENYHCLYDAIGQRYIQQCRSYERFPAGSYVFLEGGLNSKRCPQERYQSEPYNSSDFHRCLYLKASCNEEGQVIYRNGSHESDRSCRCDYRSGYSYVTRPRNLCFCIPSEEDCSCYLKQCPDGKSLLTPDYTCVGSSSLVTCPEITTTHVNPDSRKTTSADVKTEYGSFKYNIDNLSDSGTVVAVFTSCALAILVFIMIGIKLKSYISALKHLRYDEVSAIDAIKSIVKNQLIILPSNYEQMESALKTHATLLLTGREGSGKTTVALRLAAPYLKKRYQCVLLTKYSLMKGIFYPKEEERYIIIIDNPLDYYQDAGTIARYEKQLAVILENVNTIDMRLVLTLYSENRLSNNTFIQEKLTTSECVYAIAYNEDIKKKMLCSYMKKYNVDISSNEINDIILIEPYLGFPRLCDSFCKQRDHLQLGVKYFKQPPATLVDAIERIKLFGKSDDGKACEYTVLVYIFLSNMKECNTTKLDLKRFLKLKSQIFSVNTQVSLKSIEIAACNLDDQYLTRNQRGYLCYVHSAVNLAVMISYGTDFPLEVVSNSDLTSLMTVLRPSEYKPLHDESCFKIYKHEQEVYKKYAQRLATELSIAKSEAISVGKYLQSFSADYKDIILLSMVIDTVRTRGIVKPDKSPILLDFFMELTDKLYNYNSLSENVRSFALAWWFLCTRSSIPTGYQEIPITDLPSSFIIEVLNTKIDHFNNTLLHYFVVWNGKQEVQLIFNVQFNISQNNEEGKLFKSKFNPLIQNSAGQTPVDFAAYLGRSEMFVTLFRIIKLQKSGFFENKMIPTTKWMDNIKQGKTMTNEIKNTHVCVSVDHTLCKSTLFGAEISEYEAMEVGLRDAFNLSSGQKR